MENIAKDLNRIDELLDEAEAPGESVAGHIESINGVGPGPFKDGTARLLAQEHQDHDSSGRTTRYVSEKEICQAFSEDIHSLSPGMETVRVWGIPRGGWCIAQILARNFSFAETVEYPTDADILVDDIQDSGRTRELWTARFPDKQFWTPYKTSSEWIVFPWEKGKDDDARELVARILEHIGEDPRREGLVETPDRVVRSWSEFYSGYTQDPATVLAKHFESDSDQMVVVRDIEFYSTCEHHMVPFVGRVHIGYLPNGRVIGVSKLARLVEVFSRRLQLQERMTEQIAQAIIKHIPGVTGAAVVVTGRHLCMQSRGIAKQNSEMVTSCMLGEFRDQAATRSEFMTLAGLK